MSKKKIKNKILNIFTRYLILLIIALPNLNLFYLVFTPLTIYPVFYFMKIFFDVVLIKNVLIVNGIEIELIEACIAGAAYYFLLILNLGIDIDLKKRLSILFFSFSVFLIINLIRIISFIFLFMYLNQWFFDFAHRLFWYVMSSVIVVGVWILTVRIFNIKGIPIWDDLKFLFGLKKNK